MKTKFIALPASVLVATLSSGGLAYNLHEDNVASSLTASSGVAYSATYVAFDRRISGKKGIQYRRSPADVNGSRSYYINESKKSHRPAKPDKIFQDCGLTPNKSRKPGIASYRVSALDADVLPGYSL